VLPETATRIDLDDEDAILHAAAQISRRELLAPLHLLTAADSMATGPATWSQWTASLIGALVSRLDAALSDDVDGAGIAERGEAVRAEALASMSEASTTEREFVEDATLRYLASRTPAQISRDARLVATCSSPAPPRKRISRWAPARHPKPTRSQSRATDRPELLARIAGAMSLAGLDILSVDA